MMLGNVRGVDISVFFYSLFGDICFFFLKMPMRRKVSMIPRMIHADPYVIRAFSICSGVGHASMEPIKNRRKKQTKSPAARTAATIKKDLTIM